MFLPAVPEGAIPPHPLSEVSLWLSLPFLVAMIVSLSLCHCWLFVFFGGNGYFEDLKNRAFC
jgi:hypothetical protein